MPRREQHNIESNCVTFEDDCWNETNLDTKKTGEDFKKEIEQKVNTNEQRD